MSENPEPVYLLPAETVRLLSWYFEWAAQSYVSPKAAGMARHASDLLTRLAHCRQQPACSRCGGSGLTQSVPGLTMDVIPCPDCQQPTPDLRTAAEEAAREDVRQHGDKFGRTSIAARGEFLAVLHFRQRLMEFEAAYADEYNRLLAAAGGEGDGAD